MPKPKGEPCDDSPAAVLDHQRHRPEFIRSYSLETSALSYEPQEKEERTGGEEREMVKKASVSLNSRKTVRLIVPTLLHCFMYTSDLF